MAELPRGLRTSKFVLADGTPVGLILDWDHVAYLIRRAQSNRSRTSTAGPIRVVLPKVSGKPARSGSEEGPNDHS